MQTNTTWNKELAVVADILNKAPKAVKWGAEILTYG